MSHFLHKEVLVRVLSDSTGQFSDEVAGVVTADPPNGTMLITLEDGRVVSDEKSIYRLKSMVQETE